ncbi:hypothetical protein B0T20DRAFT_487899 [Sordaria brevicollis]|uniref:Uncharacterized protein n=1 Tax=Sordaria brevicollis TaxID=83679 RepID=A0AAE0P334_SORBR|nr:hypothetical protein B0T20DRAFT_487899 [Sordaria brevicollis]
MLDRYLTELNWVEFLSNSKDSILPTSNNDGRETRKPIVFSGTPDCSMAMAIHVRSIPLREPAVIRWFAGCGSYDEANDTRLCEQWSLPRPSGRGRDDHEAQVRKLFMTAGLRWACLKEVVARSFVLSRSHILVMVVTCDAANSRACEQVHKAEQSLVHKATATDMSICQRQPCNTEEISEAETGNKCYASSVKCQCSASQRCELETLEFSHSSA